MVSLAPFFLSPEVLGLPPTLLCTSSFLPPYFVLSTTAGWTSSAHSWSYLIPGWKLILAYHCLINGVIDGRCKKNGDGCIQKDIQTWNKKEWEAERLRFTKILTEMLGSKSVLTVKYRHVLPVDLKRSLMKNATKTELREQRYSSVPATNYFSCKKEKKNILVLLTKGIYCWLLLKLLFS